MQLILYVWHQLFAPYLPGSPHSPVVSCHQSLLLSAQREKIKILLSTCCIGNLKLHTPTYTSIVDTQLARGNVNRHKMCCTRRMSTMNQHHALEGCCCSLTYADQRCEALWSTDGEIGSPFPGAGHRRCRWRARPTSPHWPCLPTAVSWSPSTNVSRREGGVESRWWLADGNGVSGP